MKEPSVVAVNAPVLRIVGSTSMWFGSEDGGLLLFELLSPRRSEKMETISMSDETTSLCRVRKGIIRAQRAFC
jgi:hypothetical protein